LRSFGLNKQFNRGLKSYYFSFGTMNASCSHFAEINILIMDKVLINPLAPTVFMCLSSSIQR
jgi:uncharacterized membrane protein